MNDITLRAFAPTDIDWLVEQHQTLYAREAQFDASFGPLVHQILEHFVRAHDPNREKGWIALDGAQRLGSIFCVKLTEDTAKLRLFLLVPEARGRGLGMRLLQTCMAFAQSSGYAGMELWTHESHAAACALYRKTGWSCMSSKPVRSFGVDLVEQSWTIAF